MITERTLRKWRREALIHKEEMEHQILLEGRDSRTEFVVERIELCNRILRMTQELLDQHLLRKEVR